jgi:H+/Cl- antiporter ClcA
MAANEAHAPLERDEAAAGDSGVAIEEAAERKLAHAVVWGALFAAPIGVVVALALVFLATRIAGVPSGTPEVMAIFVGLLFGLFFGALSGFVRNTAALDDLDLHAGHAPAPAPH